MKKNKIMIVEDDIIVAKNIHDRLNLLGYEVAEIISSGEDAIIKAKEIKPDLVLMDIILSGTIDGVDTVKEIQKNLNIPVIYVSAFSDKETLERAKLTKPYGYILKPFEIGELHSNIEVALYKHEIELKLKNHEKWLSDTLESIGDAVITTDLDENITFINNVAEKLTGWKRNYVIGKPLRLVFNIFNEKNKKPYEIPVKNAMKNNKIISLDTGNIILTTKKGQEIPIDDSASPLRDAKGSIIGSVLVFRDITKRKSLEKQVKKHTKDLEKAVKTRTKEVESEKEKYKNLFEKSFDC